ncbi:MAG: hypothetical protein P1P88_12775 [Bacteroidales bacterium]|nr:hypothetical protein [Bacteroidales bacterium]
MGFSIADQYYLKALDSYPFDLTESVENLNYALSYSKQHTQANCLMARVYSEQLSNHELATYYFEQALAHDLTNTEAIKYYTMMLIDLRDFKKAKKMIAYGYTVKGISKFVLLRYEALLAEYQKEYKGAKKYLKIALSEAYNESATSFIKSEISRVKAKLKQLKKENKPGEKQHKKKKGKKKACIKRKWYKLF